MNGKRFPVDIEKKFTIWIREDSLPVFLLHHVPLRGKILVVESERRHSLRLRPQDRFEIIRRNDLVINGDVVRGVSVVFAADVLGQILKASRRQMLVPLEHHVFEEVSKTAAAVGIVLRADVIPNLDGHGRALVIFDRVNLKPVRQGHVLEVQRRNGDSLARRRAFRTEERRSESEAEQNEAEEDFHESPIP